MGSNTSRQHVARQNAWVLTLVVTIVCLALAVVLPASGAPPTISQKQQRAKAILSELDSLDSDLNRAVEAYNGARVDLARTEQAIKANRQVLKVARRNLRRSQQQLAQRLRAIYMSGERAGTIEILLGAKSLDEVLSGFENAQLVVEEDKEVAGEAAAFRARVSKQQAQLIEDRERVAKLVAGAKERRAAIESSIRKRQALFATVKDEIARMQEAERQHQIKIAAQVRARLAAQRLAREAVTRTPPSTTTESGFDSPPSTAAPPDPATTDSSPAVPQAPAPAPTYGGIVDIAMQYLGVPYTWGGASPSTGFDCSGFTMFVYAQVGVSLPHYTGDQWRVGAAVSREDLQPGDLVFFDGLGHEGIYIGNNQFIHAPHTGDVVKISAITGWYADTYMGARRL